MGHDLYVGTSSSLENLIEKEVTVVYKSWQISPDCLVPLNNQGVPQGNIVKTIFQIKADDSVGAKNLKTAYPFH